MTSDRALAMPVFAAATLLPALFLAVGALSGGLAGGLWVALALAWLTTLPFALDHALAATPPAPPPNAPPVAPPVSPPVSPPDEHPGAPPDASTNTPAEFPAGGPLLVALALAALSLPFLVLHAATHTQLSLPHKAALIFGTGLWLGQIAHPAAHELIHRSDRRLFRLGVLVYAAFLIGHHASAHRLIHHRFVATRDDPATARRGEGFWRFALRASAMGYRQGYRAETALRQRNRAGPHPYAVYAALSVASLALAGLVAGATGMLLWLILAAHMQMQVHLSDYVQHYGLRRRTLPDGRPEPVGPAHAWNSAHAGSTTLLLNAPRHSDHHAHPARPFVALRLPETAPRLPWPLPVAAVIALFPPVWHRLMAAPLSRLHNPE